MGRLVNYTLICGVLLSVSLYSCRPVPPPQKPAPVVEKKKEVPEEKIELIKGADLYELPTTRDPDDIHRTVSVRMGGISYCYKKHIDQTGKTHGRLVISFTITTSGYVKDVAIVESDFEKEEFYDCLIDRISRWRFEEISSKGEEPNVQYPFEF